MIPNYQIRAAARRLLGGQIFGQRWLLALVGCLLYELVAGLASSMYVGFIFFGFFELSLAIFLLRPVRTGEEVRLDDLFKSFSAPNLTGTLLTGLLKFLYIFLWTLLFFIPGLVKSYSYALTGYVRADRPELSANETITESRRLMNGHKLDLFFLDLSFIGWYLIGALCCGIGTLFVAPYHYLSRALFYEAILRSEQPSGAQYYDAPTV